MLKTEKPIRLKATILALALASLPLASQAAGLGKLTVLSPLGQPLRAELDITASRDELSSMTAKLASPDAFKQAGIEFVPALTAIRLMVEKRANGQPFIRVTSDRPVNEPFLDLLVELTWSSGRMVREYTFLLDPPEAVKVSAPVSVPLVAPVARPAPAAEAKPLAPAVPAAKPVVAPVAAKQPAEAPKPKAVKPAEKPADESAASRNVKSGDTLARIAGETKPEGVSLDQMLVALFRSNQAAFDGNNMNRLKAGKILSIPDRETAAAVEAGEARKLIVAQAADFNAYRKKLAAGVAAEEPKAEVSKQVASGKIAPRVEDKTPAVEPGKDKLQVSRTEAGKMQGRIAALEEDLIARDKAVKEANSRIVELEKNLNDLKKLAELKSTAGAQMQQQAQAAKPAAPAPAPEAKKPEPVPAAAPAEKPAEPPKAAEKAPEPAPAEETKPEAKPAEAVPPAQKRTVVKKPVAPPPQPEEAPGFIDENPELVFGGGGVLALLLGFLGYKAWRKKKAAAGDMGPTSRITEGSLTANSVFGTTGGQSIDTSSAGASLQTDFSHSSMSAIDADEGVDPVAEADVYMAYGRDAQAEEILIDALKNDPTRHAIHLKLLEIYAARKSAKQFETLASDLYGQTGGAGADWDKAAAMGRTLDPTNPLYGGGKPVDTEATAVNMAALAATTIVVPPSEADKMKDTVTMPGELAQLAQAAEVPAPAPVEEVASLDFDLDLGAAAPAVAVEAPKADEALSLDFDLDLGAPEAPVPQAEEAAHLDVDLELPAEPAAPVAPVPPAAEVADTGNVIDFDLDIGGAETVEAAPAPAMAAAAAPEAAAGLDFEFDLGEPAAPAAAAPSVPEMDLSSISLDLEAPAGSDADGENPEVATKLELAQAYEEMGDKEGARELLQEVLNEGGPAQQEAARAKLAQLEG